MRIAFFADSLDKQYGGIHVFTKELLTALTEIDRKNEYLIVRAEAKNEFPNAKEIIVPYSTLPGHRAWRIFHKFPKVAIEQKADIVIEPAHFGPFNLPKHVQRVTVLHDMTMFLFPQNHVYSSQLVQRFFLPRIFKKADHIITNSKHTNKDLNHFFPATKNKSTAIHLGKNNFFHPQQNTKPILKKYGLQYPFILCTSTIEPRKNLISLIQAFEVLKKESGLPHQLVLVGKKGWKTAPIFKALEQSPFKKDIFQLGFVPNEDLAALYSSTELFVYPSKYEGFGLPVLEAMACGAPVLISNSSSLPEVGGNAATFFNPDSVEDLTNKMRQLCSNKGILSRKSIKSLEQAAKFSWENTAQGVLQVFENLEREASLHSKVTHIG